MGLVPCIAVSTGYILLTMFLAETLRKVVKATIPVGLARYHSLDLFSMSVWDLKCKNAFSIFPSTSSTQTELC